MLDAPRYNAYRMRDDMVAKGWLSVDLARRAKVNPASVTRFFSGAFQTARMAKRLSKALGKSPDHYLIRSTEAA
jgi:plasmid maintenance system antidote protein VapI